jgi:carboxypeptidase family protein
MRARGRWLVAVVLSAAVMGWPSAATAGARTGSPGTAPDRPAEQSSDGAACGTGAERPYVLTTTPTLAARQSHPDSGRQNLTTTFAWWRIDGTPGGAGRATQSSGNPSAVSAVIPAGLLADGGTYAWRARTFDGTRYGPWSVRCEFTVDTTAPEPPAGVTSTDYPADGPHGGPGVPGEFVISPPQVRPEEVVAYAWTVDGGIGPAGADVVPADPSTHGATLTFAPARDGIFTLHVWSKDRAGRFSTPVTWTFFVKAATQPQPVRPLTPSISFPDGNTAVEGGTLSMRLDANGDESVTQFRYSVRSAALNLTATPNQPGGFAIVHIPVGTLSGTSNVYAVASNGTTDSLITVGSFQVQSLTSLTGLVIDGETFLPVEGATVRVEPGGHQTTTTATGEFSFPAADLPIGDYTVSASYGACSAEQPVSVSGGGDYVELYFFPGGCETGNDR